MNTLSETNRSVISCGIEIVKLYLLACRI